MSDKKSQSDIYEASPDKLIKNFCEDENDDVS
jgi:hypothetical protein